MDPQGSIRRAAQRWPACVASALACWRAGVLAPPLRCLSFSLPLGARRPRPAGPPPFHLSSNSFRFPASALSNGGTGRRLPLTLPLCRLTRSFTAAVGRINHHLTIPLVRSGRSSAGLPRRPRLRGGGVRLSPLARRAAVALHTPRPLGGALPGLENKTPPGWRGSRK